MGSMSSNEIRIENCVLAENQKGLIIKMSTDNDQKNPMIQNKWYITALARPDCPKCYNAALGNICKN